MLTKKHGVGEIDQVLSMFVRWILISNRPSIHRLEFINSRPNWACVINRNFFEAAALSIRGQSQTSQSDRDDACNVKGECWHKSLIPGEGHASATGGRAGCVYRKL